MSRICILTSVHPAFDIRIFHKQARSLAEAGYDVMLVTRDGESQVVEGVQLIALPKPGSRLWRIVGMWRMLQVALQEHADVYHFHDPELILVGLLLKFLTNKVVIYDVHEDYLKFFIIKHWLPQPVRKIVAATFWVLERFACLFFDAIIAATDDIAGNFRDYKRKVVTIKNYPLLVELPPRRRPVGTGPQAVLLYIGALSIAAGIPQMVEALAYVDDHFDGRLRLAGRFAGDDCQRQIEVSDRAAQVEYLGWLSQAEIREQLSHADVGMACLQPMPQFITSEPNKLFEYMHCGLPVVASNFPLWREIIEGEDCGVVVNPCDSRAIGQAVTRLLADPARMSAMGENGRRAVQEKYNWESQKVKLLEIYAVLTHRATTKRIQ